MKTIIISLFALLTFVTLYSQTSLLTLESAIDRFQQQNLQLLAERCNIDMAHARVIQAKLFDNPTLNFEQNVYNSINKQWFDFGHSGESIISLEQVIKLAGQRGKLIRYEQINHQMAIAQFEDLVRILIQTLKDSYIELYFATKSLTVFDREIEQLDRMVRSAEEQNRQGNISLLELSRLKALLLSLRSEKNEWENRRIELLGTLNTLLSFPQDMELSLAFDETILDGMAASEISFASLVAKIEFRADVRNASLGLDAANANLKYQKSLRAPDFSIFGTYDKAGSFISDYFGIGFNITLPFFNRNQGGVKEAGARIEQSRKLREFSRLLASNELAAAYRKYERAGTLYRHADSRLEKDFDHLLESVVANFTKRNISLLEFVDFYTGYKDACLQINRVKRNLITAMEEVNTAVGETVFKY